MRATLSLLAAAALLTPCLPALAQDSPMNDVEPAGAGLGELQHRLDSLRAEVDRSDARVRSLLGDGALGAARIAITHENRMSSLYRLTRAVYVIDGQPVFTQTDTAGSLAGRTHFDVFSGALGAGSHVLTVNLDYVGAGYGVFDYAHAYHFHVHSTYLLAVPQSGDLSVHVVGWEGGGPTAAMDARPSLRFEVRTAGRDVR